MSIAINADLCKGCKACMAVCPGSLIKETTEGKAYMKYPKDCWGCASCVKECHFGAITFFLGADIGGMGSKGSDGKWIQSEGTAGAVVPGI